jgi:hypothetical protein
VRTFERNVRPDFQADRRHLTCTLRPCRWIASPAVSPAAAHRQPVKAGRNAANKKGPTANDRARFSSGAVRQTRHPVWNAVAEIHVAASCLFPTASSSNSGPIHGVLSQCPKAEGKWQKAAKNKFGFHTLDGFSIRSLLLRGPEVSQRLLKLLNHHVVSVIIFRGNGGIAPGSAHSLHPHAHGATAGAQTSENPSDADLSAVKASLRSVQ